MKAADVDDLADVVGVVGADVGDRRRVLFDRLVVGGFYEFFQVLHYFIELLDGVVPLLGVEGGEGFVVVAAELGRSDAFEFVQDLGVPEDEVVGKLSDGVVAFAVGPVGLVGGESFDGYVAGDEPVFIIVRGFELLQEDAAERGGFLVWFVLGLGKERQGDQECG